MPQTNQRRIRINQEESEPSLSLDPDKHFPCLANVLKIQTDKKFGRYVVAKTDIDVGQTLLLEDPFVFVMDISDRTLCFTCSKAVKNFIPCRNCVCAMFCDEQCMRKNQIHKVICGSVCNLPPRPEVFSIVIALNAFPEVDDLMEFVDKQLASPKFEIPKSCPDAQAEYGMFLKLNSLPTDATPEEIRNITFSYQCIMDIPAVKVLFNSKRKQRFLQHLIWQHRLIIKNGLSKGFRRGEYGGLGIIQSLFNHSCMPNLQRKIVKNKLCYITIRPAKKGEQLFISYIDKNDLWDLPTEERQTYLLDNFKFKCTCARCIPKFNLRNEIQMLADPLTKFFMSENLKNEEVTTVKQKCYEFLRKYGHLQSCDETAVVMYNLMIYIDDECQEYLEHIFGDDNN